MDKKSCKCIVFFYICVTNLVVVENMIKKVNALKTTSKFFPQKLNAYIVIGDPNMGKSSVLRHLYGSNKGYSITANKMKRKMIMLANNIPVEVCLLGYCSLQEASITPAAYFNAVSSISPAISNVVMALQLYDAKNRKGWDASDYIGYFTQNGWNIAAVAVLDTNVNNNYGIAPYLFPNSKTVYSTLKGNPVCPTNAVAADVRKHFGWV